mgnify:CR=1 FL=1
MVALNLDKIAAKNRYWQFINNRRTKEVDNADKDAYHIWLEDEEGIQAYARILPPGTTFEEASIHRQNHCKEKTLWTRNTDCQRSDQNSQRRNSTQNQSK